MFTIRSLRFRDFTVLLLATAVSLSACKYSTSGGGGTGNQPSADSAGMSSNGSSPGTAASAKEEALIRATLDSFNRAAARADYNTYFSYYADDAVFAGTDATERWDKKAFMVWAKPFFDRGRAWDFTAINRNIYFGESGNIAWFDELLSTQMKICRGSGVMVKQGSNWKLKQYILSATFPNDLLDTVIALKAPLEDSIIRAYRSK